MIGKLVHLTVYSLLIDVKKKYGRFTNQAKNYPKIKCGPVYFFAHFIHLWA